MGIGWLATFGLIICYILGKTQDKKISFLYVGVGGLVAALEAGYLSSLFAPTGQPTQPRLGLWDADAEERDREPL